MLGFMVMVYLFVLMPLGVMWSGFALSKLWAWFLVPALGVPPLSIPAAIGLALVVSYMTYQGTNADKDRNTTERVIDGALTLALKPAIALGFGWVVAQWM